MIPPTPTFLPPGIPHFILPSEFSLWAGAPVGIQVWNWIGNGQIIVQMLAIIGLIIAGVFIVWKFFSKMTTRDSES